MASFIEGSLESFEREVRDLRKMSLEIRERCISLSGKVQRISDGTDLDAVESKGDRENYRARIHLISELCKSISISVSPVRDESQKVCYDGACTMIAQFGDDLSRIDFDDLASFNNMLMQLESAYRSTGSEDITQGPVNAKFEGRLMGCTIEDQKSIKKDLKNLLETTKRLRSKCEDSKRI